MTCAGFYAAMLPVWAWCSRFARKTLKVKQVPLLAIAAAFSFIVMLIDFPLPGGVPSHATAAGLIAILLGPWLACIAVSVTIVIQAFIGDGGITAIGANCFNMAFVSVFVSYYLFRCFSFKASRKSLRRLLSAGIASYLGITVAAFLTGIEVGLQKGAYSPYGVKDAALVLSAGHLFLFGWVEFILTVIVLKFLQKEGRIIEDHFFY